MSRASRFLRALSLSLLFTMPCVVHAQMIEQPVDERRPSYGLYGDFNSNHHSADFRTLPGVPNCCPRFESGSGTGMSGGLFYGLPLSDVFQLDVRAGYSSLNATLTERETTTVSVDGKDTPGTFEHSVTAAIGTIGIEPLLGYKLFGNLAVRAGARAGFVMSKTYSQKEFIVEPTTRGTFENGRRTRNELSGDIPDAAGVMLSALAGVSYSLPLSANGSLHAEPEALYALGLTPIVSGMTWSASSLRFGLGIRYTPQPSPPEPEPPAPKPEVKPEPVVVEKPVEKPAEPVRKEPALTASLSVMNVSESREIPSKKLTIEEFINTQMHPILNFVFFDENSSTLPSRYRRLNESERESFRVERLFDYRTLDLYYDVLNIIGRRLIENPKSTITLTGCNSNVGVEANNKDLSKSRAESVRQYFRDAWGVADNRMKIVARNLPDNPSIVNDTDGMVENRRVEIYSDDWKVMQPVLTTDTLRQPMPAVVRLKPNVFAEAGLRDWKIVAEQNDRVLHEFTGKGSIAPSIDWKLEEERGSLLKTFDHVSYKLIATDVDGRSATAFVDPVPVEQVTLKRKHEEQRADTIVARYSLILFEFNNGELNRNNKRITDFVRERVQNNATVSIVGYTDRTGADEYNRQLSQARAEATAASVGIRGATVKGLGKSILLYDNTLPEGRFYCRTVTVTVTTPTKK